MRGGVGGGRGEADLARGCDVFGARSRAPEQEK